MVEKVSSIASRFNEKYEKILAGGGKVIEFKEEFNNGTGYFDPVTHLVGLGQGEEAVMVDPLGRRCILVGTLFGTVIVFQRYTDRPTHWGCNYPQALKDYGLYTGSTGITEEEPMIQMLGDFRANIGERLKRLLENRLVIKYVNTVQHAKTPTND
jgi:hypothetical protein